MSEGNSYCPSTHKPICEHTERLHTNKGVLYAEFPPPGSESVDNNPNENNNTAPLLGMTPIYPRALDPKAVSCHRLAAAARYNRPVIISVGPESVAKSSVMSLLLGVPAFPIGKTTTTVIATRICMRFTEKEHLARVCVRKTQNLENATNLSNLEDFLENCKRRNNNIEDLDNFCVDVPLHMLVSVINNLSKRAVSKQSGNEIVDIVVGLEIVVLLRSPRYTDVDFLDLCGFIATARSRTNIAPDIKQHSEAVIKASLSMHKDHAIVLLCNQAGIELVNNGAYDLIKQCNMVKNMMVITTKPDRSSPEALTEHLQDMTEYVREELQGMGQPIPETLNVFPLFSNIGHLDSDAHSRFENGVRTLEQNAAHKSSLKAARDGLSAFLQLFIETTWAPEVLKRLQDEIMRKASALAFPVLVDSDDAEWAALETDTAVWRNFVSLRVTKEVLGELRATSEILATAVNTGVNTHLREVMAATAPSVDTLTPPLAVVASVSMASVAMAKENQKKAQAFGIAHFYALFDCCKGLVVRALQQLLRQNKFLARFQHYTDKLLTQLANAIESSRDAFNQEIKQLYEAWHDSLRISNCVPVMYRKQTLVCRQTGPIDCQGTAKLLFLSVAIEPLFADDCKLLADTVLSTPMDGKDWKTSDSEKMATICKSLHELEKAVAETCRHMRTPPQINLNFGADGLRRLVNANPKPAESLLAGFSAGGSIRDLDNSVRRGYGLAPVS